jgi:hypothetical protein
MPTTIEREFYRSARGPAPTDEDTWHLVFDPTVRRLGGRLGDVKRRETRYSLYARA